MSSNLIQAGDLTLRVDPNWPDLSKGPKLVEVAGVAVDSKNRVYVFNRGDHPMAIFEPDGTFIGSWGEDIFNRAHNVFIGPDDSVYAVDAGDHTTRKFTTEGELLMTLGTPNVPSDTGVTDDYRTIKYGGPPFNVPTKAVLNKDGDLFVSDGYKNARVHRFTADGELVNSWGEPGEAQGHFDLCHSLTIHPDGTVIVCDRENSRLQLFDQDGTFLEEWTDLSRPCDVYIGPDGLIYVAELGHKGGLSLAKPTDNPGIPSVSIWTRDHERVGIWGDDDFTLPGAFFCPHGIAIDGDGSIYVAEVTVSGDAGRGVIPDDLACIQKFEVVR
ncbi:MAG: hypothetical protein HQ478_12320 [Chloroflexi bacterium]|nr:hypothetical protein [Chloroflexota bacterium]